MHLLRSRLQVNSAFRQELSTSPIRFRPKFTPRFHPVEAPARYRRLEQPQHQPARSRQIRCRSNRARPLQKWKQAGARLHQGPSDCRRPRSTRLCLIARRLNRRVHPPQSNETAAVAAIADLEASPCSVVSSPPPSSQPPPKPSSSSPASTTTDHKGDPRNLALFDEAIYLCGRFCDLVEEDRKKRRGAAEARGEGGGA
jgi:hypothetical protein